LQRIVDIGAAIGARSRQGREQPAGLDAPRVGGQAADVDLAWRRLSLHVDICSFDEVPEPHRAYSVVALTGTRAAASATGGCAGMGSMPSSGAMRWITRPTAGATTQPAVA